MDIYAVHVCVEDMEVFQNNMEVNFNFYKVVYFFIIHFTLSFISHKDIYTVPKPTPTQPFVYRLKLLPRSNKSATSLISLFLACSLL